MTVSTFDISNPQVSASSYTSQLFSEIAESPKFIIVGGRPTSGKTTFGIDFLRSVSLLSGKSSLFFSLESSTKEILNRLIAQHSDVAQNKIATGTLSADEEAAVKNAKDEISTASIFLWHDKEPSLEEIRQICVARKNSADGLDMVFIDYLQLMSVSTGVSSNRQEAVATISHGLKILSKELGITIVLFSQLGREVVNRENKIPLISDLRDSGALEQDADTIVLIYRPSLYDTTAATDESFAIVAKNRSGALGTYRIKKA